MTARPFFHHLDVPSGEADGSVLPFEMQPIMQLADGRVTACELLYRGAKPVDWTKVDAAVIRFLKNPQPALMPVYVNLSNDTITALAATEFAHVVSANNVTFELSEAVAGYGNRDAIAEQVNRMIDAGAQVALDDFGAGRDGLQRLYSIRQAAAVKIDREFLLTCMRRPDARRMLTMLIDQWHREGVSTIAEGVETEEMYEFAVALDVECVQGWYVDALVGMRLRAPATAGFSGAMPD